MTKDLHLPIEEVTGSIIDVDRAADFLELSAFFSESAKVRTSELTDKALIAGEEDFTDVDAEIVHGEELIIGATDRIHLRYHALCSAYPFELDRQGDILSFKFNNSIEQAAYILCLVLSNLRSFSAILTRSQLHPNDGEVRELRQYFQYVATAALAAEVRGKAWSFGFPRPDGSGFLDKLTKIWEDLRDGRVEPQIGAPAAALDDQVDVFAARPPEDELPGFLVAAAQVATGKNMREKSLKGHIGAFKSRWFGQIPVTEILVYMIVPFAIADEQFVDDIRTLGNVLHRLRVPRRVAEAQALVNAGVQIEGYDRLEDAKEWLVNYREHAAT